MCFFTKDIQIVLINDFPQKFMKIDPYKHKERYLAWKEKVQRNSIPNISTENSKIILDYIYDMEMGLNVSIRSIKGARGYPRLNNLRQRMTFIAKLIETHLGVTDLKEVQERDLFRLFNSMRSGEISRQDGKAYQSVVDYVKPFKAFWHWYMKANRKKGVQIEDITLDLDTSHDKPKWVYLTEEEVKKLANNSNFKYRVLILFLYDSGVRSPTELMNIKVSDLYNKGKELSIRDEISKTFGRRIKLLFSSDLLNEYIKENNKGSEDYIFDISPQNANKYLQRLATKLFGDKTSPAGKKYSELTMYHLRHCSCCYWLPRYKSEPALKYRFGWKKSDKIHYYTELLGMRDTITEEDMLIDITKTELEQRSIKAENRIEILIEENNQMRLKLSNVESVVKMIENKINQIIAS
ncbi:MAG: hypothetical protein ACI83O_000379 [Patescibacteria group bacterium]